MFAEWLNPAQSTIILIRHGASEYTDQFPDLTREGLDQIQRRASILGPLVKQYSQHMAFSSPAARARGTTQVLIEQLGMPSIPVIIEPTLSPLIVHNLPQYLAYLVKHDTPTHGENWLTNPEFEIGTLTEPRSSVEARAHMFLDSIIRLASMDKQCYFAVTHLEIMAPLMRAIYGTEQFPINTEPAPGNGEALIIQPDQYDPRQLMMIGRGRQVLVTHNPELRTFEPVV